MLRFFLIFAVLCVSVLSSHSARADEPPIYTSWHNNLAVGGYDIVSFYAGTPVEGKADFTVEYQGAEWQFSTQGNRDLFQTNPEVFLPQYGGYCAWAVAKGKLAKGSPQHFLLEDGKLYFNFNSRIQRRWNKKREDFIMRADANWPEILND